MRELNAKELNEVSGAGAFADAGTFFGQGVGTLLGAFGVKGALDASKSLGTGIGQAVEAGLATVSSIVDGFFSLFGYAPKSSGTDSGTAN